MTTNPPIPKSRDQTAVMGPILWVGLMVLAGLSVWLINGKPLFYYDSPAYVDQGLKILDRIGFQTDPIGGGSQDASEIEQDSSVSGSRSAVFSAVVATLVRLRGLEIVPLVNFSLVAVSVWLAVRVMNAGNASGIGNAKLITLPILVACAGSLPFYVAFVMPDVMAAVLLLMIAVLTTYSAQMQRPEMLLAFVLGGLAVVSHISHIAIAAAMLPVVALGALAMGNRNWWLPTLLVGLMVLGGLGERVAFRVAAKSVAGAEVVYIPFLTARLIEDGPGLRYLESSCPDDDLKSCLLYKALSNSDDPLRLTASHIIFETNPQLGSFKFLSREQQGAVAREQYQFFFAVLVREPLGTLAAIVRNTAIQAAKFSVEMTIPTDHILGNTHAGYPALVNEFSHGRITAEQNWLDPLEVVHTALYALSTMAIIAGLVWRMPGLRQYKGFVFIVLLGIAANAFVCGAVSQPADRYGARVIWLLPFMAAIFGLLLAARRQELQR